MKKASDLLQSFFLKHGIDEGDMYVSFFSGWERIVGSDLAAHAEVCDIRNGALVVRVDHPAWMQILHMRKDDVIRKVNDEFPDLSVSAIHMQLVDSSSPRRVAGDEKPDSRRPRRNRANTDTENREDEGSGNRLQTLLRRLEREVEARTRDDGLSD